MYKISYVWVVVTLMSGRTCMTLAPHALNALPWLGLTSPEMHHAAMWQSSWASVWRSLLGVSVTLIARSTWHTCVTLSPVLTLRHVALPAVLRSVLDQRTSTPAGRPGPPPASSGVSPRHARRKTVRSRSAMSWIGRVMRWAEVKRGSADGLEGAEEGAFLRVALGRAVGVEGVASGAAEADGRAGVKEESKGTLSSSESLRMRTTEDFLAAASDGLGGVVASFRRAGVGAVRLAIELSLRGVGSLRPSTDTAKEVSSRTLHTF